MLQVYATAGDANALACFVEDYARHTVGSVQPDAQMLVQPQQQQNQPQ
jgi:hypothetical protein